MVREIVKGLGIMLRTGRGRRGSWKGKGCGMVWIWGRGWGLRGKRGGVRGGCRGGGVWGGGGQIWLSWMGRPDVDEGL